ncbi:glycosyltransferase [Pseudoteredinibacter isoporae]|uniref:Glycosyltransferase involved in cell wall biosynthesis n=1 Tax=Pseudoteredinibacter isoporae TaxID=570281 RepID=A0A7X0MZ30_9GAMM|nr:glycosyltransferase [Pseudoteredinibacter isoporae]MBB6522707.1 glycosyltransferase involved in cell wall biosynthesis [Pseudoteredinibacter isoporae]NHO88237.1 glycosyltransferase [Pseudoteredinibacter isoporae]NIB23432.1 glycosyltransferase [Pseudoteredinibacter isoporae]
MKRILLITTSFPQSFTGQEAAGTFVFDFCLELAKHADLHVMHPGSKEGSWETDDGFTVHGFCPSSKALSLLKLYRPGDAVQIFNILRKGNALAKQLVKEYSIDHVVCLWALPCAYWARSTGLPYDVWALGSDIWSLGKIPIVQSVLKGVLKDAKSLYADGFQLVDDVKALSGRECMFLPSSRNLGEVEQEESSIESLGGLKLAFLGRWHENKGVDLLMAALEGLDDADWKRVSEVRIAGGGPMEQEVFQSVNKLKKIGRPVSVCGYLNKSEAVAFLLWADWFMLPSRIESVPVVFSDCMQLDLPIVAMPVGDIPRLMEAYEVGICSQRVDAPAFAEALKRILKGVSVTPGSFRKCAEEFSVSRSVETLLDRVK